VAIFRDIVERGVRTGEIREERSPHVLALFIACTMGFSHFAATIDSTQLGGIMNAFSALIDGQLFSEPRARKSAKRTTKKRGRKRGSQSR
jgi:hypothetical protein